jgi:cytoskeletal protein CcmA (bactofilin family)
MFTKKPDADAAKLASMPAVQKPLPPVTPMATAAPRPAAGLPGKSAPSTIGPDLTIMGNLVSKGEVQVDGEIQGDINCAHLVVGENARITGGIVADDVIVRGRVMGSIRGNRVTLQTSSHVEGDIYHQSLAIEQGALFEGRSRRSDNPIGEAPKMEAPRINGSAPPA